MIPEEQLLEDLKTQPLEKVLEDYDITFKELFQLQRNRNYHTKETSHITRTKSRTYSINKTINGKSYHYGSYHDKKEAEKIVVALEKKGWDINKLPEILIELNIQSKTQEKK